MNSLTKLTQLRNPSGLTVIHDSSTISAYYLLSHCIENAIKRELTTCLVCLENSAAQWSTKVNCIDLTKIYATGSPIEYLEQNAKGGDVLIFDSVNAFLESKSQILFLRCLQRLGKIYTRIIMSCTSVKWFDAVTVVELHESYCIVKQRKKGYIDEEHVDVDYATKTYSVPEKKQSKKVDPTLDLPFNLRLTEAQSRAKNEVVLPYLAAQEEEQERCVFDTDEEEDLDLDLDI